MNVSTYILFLFILDASYFPLLNELVTWTLNQVWRLLNHCVSFRVADQDSNLPHIFLIGTVNWTDSYWILPYSGLLRGLRWFETDALGLPIGSILKGQDVQDDGTNRWSCWTSWSLKMGPKGSSETSVWNHLTPRCNPEKERIQFNCGEAYELAGSDYPNRIVGGVINHKKLFLLF